MQYTLHQLMIFHKVCETQSITKAAQELHLTQPAVSIQLKNLQDQFDIPLFEVISRRLHITEFGYEIARASEKIIGEVQAIETKTLAYKGHLVGKLKISVVSTGKYVMPYFLSEFVNKHKGIDLVMDVTNKTYVVETLEKNETDFALVSVMPDNLQLEREELMENILYLVGKNAPKNGENNEIDGPLLYREPGSATRQAMERYFAKSNASKKIFLTSNEAVKQAVMSGLGYSVMPIIGIRNELSQSLIHIIPRKDLPIITMWNLVWLKGKQHSPIAKAYLEFLRENKMRIMEENFPKSATKA